MAVLGEDADLSMIAALAGLDEDRAAAAIAALARAEILRAAAGGVCAPARAAAIYNDVLLAERQLLQRRAAELLAGAGAPVQRVAGQLLVAPPRGERWAVEALANAASRAIRAGAPESAVGRALLFTGFPGRAANVARRAAADLPAQFDDLRDALEAFELFCALFGAGDRGVLDRLERYRIRPVGEGVGSKMLAAIAAQAWMYACGPSDAIARCRWLRSRAAL